ncbi:hypothetical protein [Burkholderia pseudomallei]|nr:hypothetical protein [Burkholderia pseudomallei]
MRTPNEPYGENSQHWKGVNLDTFRQRWPAAFAQQAEEREAMFARR